MTTLLFDSLSMVAGLLLLFFGAELLVRASVSIGLRVGLSKWIIGLTIVSFSTSAPRLCLVTETFPPEINGVSMTLGRLVEEWSKPGMSVTVVAPQRCGS